ncbi:mannosylglycoprotein endo-beta-mannosidase [Arachis ipaensis]|uniref:mannosylglycoprotein endo-beta-mannosidase n=1 Tax=Arachis ipaensis TaxID=130454 RepID=UPI000A2B0501|nr:mannosylglycoprotein endo-beta-mannosidase [Arachis ipaensis]
MAEQHRKTVLDSGWLAARSTEVQFTGIQLTTTHPPTSPTSPWMQALVPGTVLGTLVKNKVVPDPFYGLQNEDIVDIADSGRDYYTFWFFTTFNCKLSINQHCDLNFRGINYYADVYLNGHEITLPKGMFRRHAIDVTDILHPDGSNLLAILVHPPDHPGRIPPEGGQGGDHEVRIRFRSFSVVAYFLLHLLPQLFFYKPNLWWPNGMGKQSLYNVIINIDVKEYGESDSWSHLFGFRKIESHIDDATGGRLFKVNGEPIFIRGGNWILSDGLLRLSKKRYNADIKFHADMNLNMIRCWGGGLAERPEFYHYCDYYGLLVWQEFWITGDVDGRGDPISNPNGPLDHDLFLFCARDTVKLLRNHPSLALWVGGNEQTPPDDINTALKNDLRLHPWFEAVDETNKSVGHLSPELTDPSQYLDGTRIYIEGSLWDGFADGKGNFTDGPYEIQNPEDFFKDNYYDYGFNPEVGSVGVPVASTIRATMPPEGWKIPVFKKLSNGYVEEVPNPIWEYHKYIPYSKPSNVHDQIQLYGDAKDLDDFCLKAQLVNYVQYRALLEGWSSRMWSKYTGVLIWKTQNPWTGLRGQFYDHLLDQTAGFYGCRCAAEPIHIQLNLATYSIEVVNTTLKELSNVGMEASVWNLEGTCSYYKILENLSLLPKKVASISEMDYPKSKNSELVYFLLLKLYSMSDHTTISRNFYWLHISGGDYKLLEQYRKKKIPLRITSQTSNEGSTYKIQIQVKNTSKEPYSKSSTSRLSYVDGKDSLETADSLVDKEHEVGWFKRLQRCFAGKSDGLKVYEINGEDVGVAFFLHFSVHTSKKDNKEGEDTRILPKYWFFTSLKFNKGRVNIRKILVDFFS